MNKIDIEKNWKTACDRLDDLYSAKESGENISEKTLTEATMKVVETTRAVRRSEGRRFQ